VADVAGKSIPVAGRACDKGPFSAEPLQCADLGNRVDVPMAPVAGHEPGLPKTLNDYRPLRCFEMLRNVRYRGLQVWTRFLALE
jgi:hypothetical protein